jgi:hypothetical protein
MGKMGTLEPVEFFVNYTSPDHERGYILIASYTGCPAPEGYRAEYADTLPAVRQLEKILQRQEHRANELEWQRDRAAGAAGRQRVRDRLMSRLASSSTSEFDKDFIRAYLQVREDKAAKHEQRFTERHAYLTALNFDTPKGRAVDEETVSLDRLNVSAG